jgi:hypothetical protein
MSGGLGDVGGASDSEHADHQISEGGHGAGSGTDADLGTILVESDIANPVQAYLDAPVATDPGGEFGFGGLICSSSRSVLRIFFRLTAYCWAGRSGSRIFSASWV